MILFAPLRTPRLSVQLRELSPKVIIGLLAMPANRIEAGITEFLKHAASKAEGTTPRHVTDPRMMTVQERNRLVAHYIGHVSQDGGDFVVGEARLSDYTLLKDDWNGQPHSLTLDGRPARVWPLLGWQAEALERICESSGEWQSGAAACQIMMGSEAHPDIASLGDVQTNDWVRDRLEKLLALPESEFLHRLDVWSGADAALSHYYNISFDNDGVIVMPTDEALKRAGAKGVAPGRFPVSAAINEVTHQLFGRSVQPSR
ncbi:hypothetical protein [Nevskia ramosa]|uniref:hypothetical protein n=1 Tax=Nevskia ramosa TaxID=64002 RepID=UPI003D0B8AD7